MKTALNFAIGTVLLIGVVAGLLATVRAGGTSTAMFLLMTVRIGSPVSGYYDTGIYQARHDGSALKLVVDDPRIQELSPAWSPDLAAIYYTYLDNALRNVARLWLENGQRVLLTNGANNAQPRPSPDGQWIAFVNQEFGISRLSIMRPDGSERRLVTTTNANESQPTWSPDSQTLLFRELNPDGPQIHAYDMAAGTARFVAVGEAPVLSADGQTLFFLQFVNQQAQIAAVPFNDPQSAPTILHSAAPIDPWLAPTPDGQHLTFASRGNILQVPVDGGPATVLLARHDNTEFSMPAWSPLFDEPHNFGAIAGGCVLVGALLLAANLGRGWRRP